MIDKAEIMDESAIMRAITRKPTKLLRKQGVDNLALIAFKGVECLLQR